MEIKPKVLRRNGKQREGKGFSREELKQAGTNTAEALKLKIPIDTKRKTAHEHNIEALKTLLQSRKIDSKPKGKPKS
jgi:ribosomal protein L13E